MGNIGCRLKMHILVTAVLFSGSVASGGIFPLFPGLSLLSCRRISKVGHVGRSRGGAEQEVLLKCRFEGEGLIRFRPD